MINPLKTVEINTFIFRHPKVPRNLENFQIAQISDVHLGRWVKPRHMRQIVEFVNFQEPQLVALTGDYVGYSSRDILPCVETLSGLRHPTYAVLGNHDHWTSTEQSVNAFRELKIPVLSNESVPFSYGQGMIDLVGVDDHVTKKSDIEAAFGNVGGENFCLTLNHVPSIAPQLAVRGADLILSGHTHGFQFNIPGVTHRIARKFGTEFYAGAYRIDNSYLYINRGLGSASWPWRIRAMPELSFFRLEYGEIPRLELAETKYLNIKHRE
ncbi:MAG: metallophosphoesterase [Bradymonadaceae bacterium]|nr:metallophosphoesterase [Lujinxingiaceae bacterium]